MKNISSFLFIGLLSTSALAQGVLGDRNALNALLGGNRIDEGFEAIAIQDGAADGGPGLLSSTNDGGFGGVIVGGITLESGFLPKEESGYFILWHGNDERGTITKTISAGMSLRIDFWEPTPAFGIDLKDYEIGPSSLAAGITVYGADDITVLYTGSLALANPNPAAGVFFGYDNSLGGGIGSVVFNNALQGPGELGYSPQIDNLSFSIVPEPSTVALGLLSCGALAVLARKRRVL